jgi:hypothetical protein
MKGTLRDFVEQLAPGFEALATGALGGIQSFVEALAPAMPSINDRMKTWGEEAPRSARATRSRPY